MYVTSLEFENYRNLTRDVIYPQRDINVICGENAQGKTNLIECLWLFTGGRSFRGSKDNDLVRFGEKTARIKLCFYSSGREQTIELEIGGGKRRPVLNDVPKNSVSQIIGSFCAVVFSPDHLTLIKSGPEGRRNFIDAAICQIKPSYAVILSRYRRILSERNALLKEIPRHRELEDTLDIWDIQLAEAGKALIKERNNFINMMNEMISDIHSSITSSNEKLDLRYEPNVSIEDFEDTLKNKRNIDIKNTVTMTGPHRDDFGIYINDIDVRVYGSQGQQRTAALSLKLAEIELVKDIINDDPILLLDDVMSELDSKRREALLSRISNIQTIITCTGYDDFIKQRINVDKIYKISNGHVV